MDASPALWLSRLAKAWCNPAIVLCWDPNLLPSILPSLPQHPLLSWTPNFSAPQPNRYLYIPSLGPHSSSPSDPAPCPPHTALGTTCRNPRQPQQHQGGNSASSLLGRGTLQSRGQRRRWGCSAGVSRKAGLHSPSIPVSCGESRGKALAGWVGRGCKPFTVGLEPSAQAGSHLQVTPSLPGTPAGEVLLSWALEGGVPLPLQAIVNKFSC